MSLDGKIRVSDLMGFNYGHNSGDVDAVASSLVDYGPRIDQRQSNSNLLYPVNDMVKARGLVHDAAVDLYDSEQDIESLGVEVDEDVALRHLLNSLYGRNSSKELRNSARRLEESNALEDIDDFDLGDGTVRDYIESVAEEYQSFDTDNIEKEVDTSSRELTGRIDLMADGDIVEVKTGNPRKSHLYQGATYWMMNDDSEASVILDYPVRGKRVVMGWETPSPGSFQNEIREDIVDMKSAINEFKDILEDDELQASAEEVARKVVKDEL